MSTTLASAIILNSRAVSTSCCWQASSEVLSLSMKADVKCRVDVGRVLAQIFEKRRPHVPLTIGLAWCLYVLVCVYHMSNNEAHRSLTYS